jgi:putative lipase involved disintegration of autophagic bodies
MDVVTDVKILRSKSTLCGTANKNDGCLVHDGFLGAMNDASALVIPTVKALVEANPSYKVISTGHSLGGAIAALMGAQLRNQGLTVDMVRIS